MADQTLRPSLRIAEFAITGFRTFHERTIIPLNAGDRADALAVFHGDNGAGKSNALAALDLFFRGIVQWLAQEGGNLPIRLSWETTYPQPLGFRATSRDWPPGSQEPMGIEVRFADRTLGTFRMTLSPSGSNVILMIEYSRFSKRLDELSTEDWDTIPKQNRNSLRNLFETPRGLGTRVLFNLDAHRRGSWRRDADYALESQETLTPLLAERLFSLKLSMIPQERDRWRAFVSLLSQFPTLTGKEISIDRVVRDGVPELHFEERGRQILRLNELSSGEQQLVTLCAAVLTSRASIVAIAEPEMSLSASNQRLFREILEQQVREGQIDQVIMESHVQTFDGSEVIRFKRSNTGATQVTREVRTPEEEKLSAMAREKGAREQYVTADGFTQLPKPMRKDFGIEGGGLVWFLKDERARWTAWSSEELDELFGQSNQSPDEG